MGTCRLSLAAVATLGLLTVVKSDTAGAGSAEALAALQADASVRPALAIPVAGGLHHFRKTQSFYCYPKNYWWFYRPYTTALDNHARCMPYFHYLGPPGKSGRYIK